MQRNIFQLLYKSAGALCFGLIFISTTAQANQCGWSDHYTLQGSWAGGGNYQGTPTKQAYIIYVPAELREVTSCRMVRKKTGFPIYAIVEYQVCETEQYCTDDVFMGWITDLTFAKNHVNHVLTAGYEHGGGDWVYFDIDSSDDLRYWTRAISNGNQMTFVKEVGRNTGNYSYSTLNRK